MSHTFHKDQGLTVDPHHRHETSNGQRRRARLTVAHHARDAGELVMLLDMLGLTEQRRDAPDDVREVAS